jgi:hypothetical protein
MAIGVPGLDGTVQLPKWSRVIADEAMPVAKLGFSRTEISGVRCLCENGSFTSQAVALIWAGNSRCG